MKYSIFIKIGIIFVISSVFIFIFNYINDYSLDAQNGKRLAEDIDSLYSSFLTSLSLYKDNINETYDSFNLYLDDVPDINDLLLNKINDVKLVKNELQRLSIELDDKCLNVLNNNLLNIKCNNYSLVSSDIDDAYDKVIESYNSIILKYNKYAENNGKALVQYLE